MRKLASEKGPELLQDIDGDAEPQLLTAVHERISRQGLLRRMPLGRNCGRSKVPDQLGNVQGRSVLVVVGEKAVLDGIQEPAFSALPAGVNVTNVLVQGCCDWGANGSLHHAARG